MRRGSLTSFRPLTVAACCAAGAFGAARAAAPGDVNLTAFASGALVEASTSDYGGSWQARWITDESAATGWSSAQGASAPFDIVISLPERSELHGLEFDTASTETPERAAKDVDVAVSDTSATAGFASVATVALKPGANKEAFPVAKAAAGRWIKLTVKTNHGDAAYSQLMEFRALGKPLTTTPLPSNLSGTYHSDSYGNFHLQQAGASLTGCYEHAEGLVQGGAESHLMRLTWRERDRTGPAIMVLKRDGKSFEGWWMDKGATVWQPNWDLKKTTDTVGSCPHWNPSAATGNVVASELAAEGRVRLYGINFDVDSDRLRPDATPAIDQLIAALKANAAWTVSIEGHTDGTGTAARNLELSRLRANAVKAALVAGGIAADRMTTAGLGQTKPVAPNDTEVGRAQNRRVEVVRK
jgi:outer membrane protein OmpA-like peptidoglycan-associated protein